MTYEELYQIAENHYIKENYKEALNVFQEALKLNETNNCLNYIGCCYLELNEYKNAANIFFELSDENPDWERPAFNLGRVYLKSGYFEEALIAFKEAERRNSNDEDVNYYLGVYYRKINDYAKAKEYYEKSLEINYNQAETHNDLGICYVELGMMDKAIKEFDYAYENDNDYFLAKYNKGRVLLRTKNYSEALKEFAIVNRLIPNDIGILINIIHCYYKIEDFDNAKAWVIKLLEIEPENDYGNKLLKRLEYLER